MLLPQGTNHAPGYLDAMAAYGAVACLMPNLRKLATCYKHRDFMCLLPLRQMQHLAMLQVHSCTSDSSKLLEEVSRGEHMDAVAWAKPPTQLVAACCPSAILAACANGCIPTPLLPLFRCRCRE